MTESQTHPATTTGAGLLDRCFSSKTNPGAKLICFTTACYPDFSASLDISHRLIDAGCDILELGIPFSDPMADGSDIQVSSRHALAAGTNINLVLEQVEQFRKKNSTTPIVLMGYYNPIFAVSEHQFAYSAASAGVNGLIVVDAPMEEDQDLQHACKTHDLALIRLATPTSSPRRIRQIASATRGFLYYVSVTGTTGLKQATPAQLQAAAKLLRNEVNVPIAAGFGINSATEVRAAAPHFDAVVVGSAIIRTITNSRNNSWKELNNFVTGLAKAAKGS